MSTIVSRFRAIVQAHPGTTALLSDTEALSYAALYQRAGQMASAIDAWFLAHQGRSAGPADVIGICIDKCADLYLSILGILGTGASYVPIDPQLQRDVQEHVVLSCRCQLIVAHDALLAGVGGAAVIAPADCQRAGSLPAARVDVVRASGADIAYTIFTSGSTGRPKGVPISHTSLLNLVDWAIAEFTLAPGVRALQYSTINFDASILDIFPTLLSGATLCIPSQKQRLSEAELAEFCARHEIAHAFLSPALLASLSAQRFPGITTLLTGGEACSPQAMQDWLAGRRLYNLYGPTECTVLVSYKRMDGTCPQSNIGKAIPGVRLHVLDENREPASRGELYVAGVAVSPGYIGNANVNAQTFLHLPTLDAGRLYKTGDLVERDEQGDLRFLGRIDRQVKVRGFRVELEEIEGALKRLGYAEVAVKVSAQGALVAYIVADSDADTDLDGEALRARLASILSDYKIPQHVIGLARFPYKISGKVDYAALPDFVPAAACAGTRDDHYAPIIALWANELMLDAASLQPSSNFRELGGTSINIVRLLSSIETHYGVRIDFIDFLDNPTIEFLVHNLTEND
ncbi:amino acid adenylation domain-containing protein [Massilia sp. CCM 8695]|uniref:Amino acid adenylation domain-containing protein n=1 Tax=Massilia frigida TaxID=2609281 RepID=A0ABX0NJM0_9BURK|nr:non-ribosomal peptide synthetase [Massilia frigida]NHZ83648.1 amino acid adenylation domain-containing protein [Massilia frigida]